ncbi:MAG: hypothetical protein Q8P19_00505, partial [bacterium]|nr:hypothetical protein [bacterium]
IETGQQAGFWLNAIRYSLFAAPVVYCPTYPITMKKLSSRAGIFCGAPQAFIPEISRLVVSSRT